MIVLQLSWNYRRPAARRAAVMLRRSARLQVDGLDRTLRTVRAATLAAVRGDTGRPDAAARLRVFTVRRMIVGTNRTAGRVRRRMRRARVRMEAPRTSRGTSARSARRSRGDKLMIVDAPIIASASPS